MDVIETHLGPGMYVVAVSGGVDSMVLLDIVRRLPEVRLVVAHVNHGVRTDAAKDARLVKMTAMSYNLAFESIDLNLGSNVSEEKARGQRYDFLRHVCKKYNALAILTAHHRDDVIETAIINLLRGTGWRGLSSLRSTPGLIRPLLGTPKRVLEEYARRHQLIWRHDSTNDDTRYLRNKVRHTLLRHITPIVQERLYEYIVRQNELTERIDHEVETWLQIHLSPTATTRVTLPRYEFIMMPQYVAHELLQSILRRVIGKSVTRPLAEKALLFICVAKSHKIFELNSGWQLRALSREVIVEPRPGMISLGNTGST